MGEVIAFTCPACGYSTSELLVAPPSHPDQFDPVLVCCRSCQRLDTVHRPLVEDGCPGCGENLEGLDDDLHVDCPRCGKALLRKQVALWD